MSNKLDPATKNNDIGLYFRRTRRATIDVPFGETATWIKAQLSGDIVWINSQNTENGVINAEAGEMIPIVCTEIVTSATVAGVLETTTASGFFYAVTPTDLS